MKGINLMDDIPLCL